MAMNATVLGTAMASAMGVSGNAAALASFISIANVIITHIQTNAVITTTDTVPGTGIVAPSGGGPCTGSSVGAHGTGTIA